MASRAVPPTPSTTNLLAAPAGRGVNPPQARSLRSVASHSSLSESRYASADDSSTSRSITEKFSLSADPSSWGADLYTNIRENDDELHSPDPKRDRKYDMGGHIFTARGIVNLGCLAIIALAIIGLFAGYPIISYFTKHKPVTYGGFNIGGINASGQVPSIPGNWGVIDLETPQEAHTMTDYMNGNQWQLVFSDEFNVDGRTFYPGDDPYWEAVDLHYWQTGDLEWYDPEAITTRDGSLEVTISDKAQNGLNYTGGMMSTWNKFCFTGGLIVANVSLPGFNNVLGLWPAIWTMGNLGRAGYGASLEGMWPYTYDSCDVGTAPNQTLAGSPLAALEGGDPTENGTLSFLPGQRLSRCTCPGESHPGPIHQEDGSYVGRSAPEIDILEATMSGTVPPFGQVSQSSQWAPYDAEYRPPDPSSLIVHDNSTTIINPYRGGVFQQVVSALTNTSADAYTGEEGTYEVYGFQYVPGFDNAYITWISSGEAVWTLQQAAMGPNGATEIGPRPVPQEPMYIIVNLGMSPQFGTVDLEHLVFPATMKVDWIRVYQDPNNLNVGCDPPDFPTAAYINEYLEAYTNPNLTTWRNDFGQPFPKNKWIESC